MSVIERKKLRDFQEFIEYEFKNEELLIQSLTTPSLANEIGTSSYDFLELLGDGVIKLILILKLSRMGIEDSGEITRIKANLESDAALKNVANKINLDKYILKTEKQKIKGTRILADIFEAICGAIFLDSDHNLNLVEQKMINPFYEDLDVIIQNSKISSKNVLLEFLQGKFRTNITIEVEYEKSGEEHDPIWIVKNPKILNKEDQKEIIKLSRNLKSGKFKNKKDAEKDVYNRILKYLKRKNQFRENA
ncbi:MAG: ribonuclease III domain-containing protein [Candidatus Hodarchaeota archaeon]